MDVATAPLLLHTSLGDLKPYGQIGLSTSWLEWESVMFDNPLVEICIPQGREQDACDSLLLMQLQAVPKEKANCRFSQEYTVSVPLDEVESVSLAPSSAQYRVRVRSSCNLFNEIMLRGAVGAGYCIRLFSTSAGHLQTKSRVSLVSCAMALHVHALIRQSIPRVFVVQPSHAGPSRRPIQRLDLSQNCIVSTSIPHSESGQRPPLPFKPTMQESALTQLKNQVANEVADAMAAVLRVRHARLQRIILLNIADYIMPQLFRDHGWVTLPSSASIDIADTTTAVVLNANGFPAYSVYRKSE